MHRRSRICQPSLTRGGSSREHLARQARRIRDSAMAAGRWPRTAPRPAARPSIPKVTAHAGGHAARFCRASGSWRQQIRGCHRANRCNTVNFILIDPSRRRIDRAKLSHSPKDPHAKANGSDCSGRHRGFCFNGARQRDRHAAVRQPRRGRRHVPDPRREGRPHSLAQEGFVALATVGGGRRTESGADGPRDGTPSPPPHSPGISGFSTGAWSRPMPASRPRVRC